MIRNLAIMVFAVLTASAALPNTRPPTFEQTTPSALHLMNDSEFGVFLERLDRDMLDSKVQLTNVDVKSLGQDSRDSKELEKSHARCLQSLNNVREDIQYLSQKQTLKFDLLLLIDMNELARNLDALDQGLMNHGTPSESRLTRKLLGYAREVTAIDAALAPRIASFQNHVLAFTGVIDATLDQPELDPVQPQAPK